MIAGPRTRPICRRLAAGITLLAATACSDAFGPARADALLMLSVQSFDESLHHLVVTVSAQDIPVPLVFNLQATDGSASGTIRVPPGSGRTLDVEAFAEGGFVTHDGSANVNVRPGLNPPLPITLTPRAGQLPIVVVLGSYAIDVAPSTLQMTPGDELPLMATVQKAGQGVIAAEVIWATSHPGVAVVSEGGLVSAIGPGTATIVATYEGYAASALVVVAELTGTYAGTSVNSATGTIVSLLGQEALLNGIFGCANPCPAGAEITSDGDAYDLLVTIGARVIEATATYAAPALTLAQMSFAVPVSGVTVTCTSPVSIAMTVDENAPGGVSITGSVTFNCTSSLGGGTLTVAPTVVRL